MTRGLLLGNRAVRALLHLLHDLVVRLPGLHPGFEPGDPRLLPDLHRLQLLDRCLRLLPLGGRVQAVQGNPVWQRWNPGEPTASWLSSYRY